jgi:predicted CoA-binding protein
LSETIKYIATQKHIAVVGVSDKSFGGEIYKTLKQRGYTVYAVHPTRQTFLGDPCYVSLKAVPTNVKAAIIAVSPESAETIIDDAAASGVSHIWFQQGKNYSALVRKAQEKGIQAVSRKCILLYAQPVTGVHKFHRGLAKIFGRL